MSCLQDANQLSLSFSTENKSNKSLIFVKLTDSALQAIENFLNSQDESSSKPTIQFQDNGGILSLPQNDRNLNYKFTLSNIEGGGLQSSFQCIRQIDSSSLESLGCMSMKMQILATEDSYEKTKCKMTAADQEQKKLCTKELRQRISLAANKVCVKRPGLRQMPEKIHPTFKKPEPPKLIPIKKVICSTDFIQQPIRERIIHILAAKPYKKAELLLRLKKEGISDIDKDKINPILFEVAKIKGNIYVLENLIWNEVRDDWKFCSEEELQLIKKKKQQLLKPNNTNGVANLFKPFVKQEDPPSHDATKTPSSKKLRLLLNGALNYDKYFVQNGACFSNGNALTNSIEEHKNEETDMNNEEKMCVEETDNCNEDDLHKSKTSTFIIPKPLSVSKQCENGNDSPIQVKQLNSSSKTIVNGIGKSKNCLSVLEEIKYCTQPLIDSSKEGNKINDFSSNGLPLTNSDPEFDFSEFKLKYTKVESLEQRSKYVQDFNELYEDYTKLHTQMKEIATKFSALFDYLQACTEGSSEFEKLKGEIGKEYQKALNDSYIASRKEFELLKVKLSHIKGVVSEYDRSAEDNSYFL